MIALTLRRASAMANVEPQDDRCFRNAWIAVDSDLRSFVRMSFLAMDLSCDSQYLAHVSSTDISLI